MKVVFSELMIASARGSWPSAAKAAPVVAACHDVEAALERIAPIPVTQDQLALAHKHEYVEAVLSGREPNRFGTRSAEVIASLPYTNGAMLTRAFRRAHVGVPPGTWSDDGAHALILLDSLLEKNGLDLDHFSSGLRRWLFEGRFAVNNSVFDIGAQTSTAINRLNQGIAPDKSGPSDESHNGNGSLMRVLPLALWHNGSNTELIQLAARQSLVTHGHPRSQVVCAFYCLWAKASIQGVDAPWDLASAQLREEAPEDLLPKYEIDLVLDRENLINVRGTGYVLDTLWSARVAFESTSNYEQCVKRAIAFGHDTDTTAAVAGGMAGIRYGLAGIPARWLESLRGKPLVTPLVTRLQSIL